VLQGRDCVQRCSNEPPLFGDVDGGNQFGFGCAFPQHLTSGGELVAKTLNGTPVCDEYKPGQGPLILFAEPSGSASYFFVQCGQDFFRCLSVPQNAQQETEEQPIRGLKKELERSFITSGYPWE